MAKDTHRVGNGILGDIDPAPEPESPHSRCTGSRSRRQRFVDAGRLAPRSGGHSGSRDVTEGVTGGTGTETGGSRNYRSGSGATGGDIGNRPE